MNPEIKQRWVTALTDGSRTQGRQRLKRADGPMCCLGVLCDLAEQDGIVVSRRLDGNSSWIYRSVTDARDESRVYLPDAVMKWAGLSSVEPFVDYDERRFSLTELNDHYQLTFSQIAEIINNQL